MNPERCRRCFSTAVVHLVLHLFWKLYATILRLRFFTIIPIFIPVKNFIKDAKSRKSFVKTLTLFINPNLSAQDMMKMILKNVSGDMKMNQKKGADVLSATD